MIVKPILTRLLTLSLIDSMGRGKDFYESARDKGDLEGLSIHQRRMVYARAARCQELISLIEPVT